MTTVFIGGSRRMPRLPPEARSRLDNVIEKKFSVVVGDADGADKAVQRHLAETRHDRVTVFCSGQVCRNNIGFWRVRNVAAAGPQKSFQFHAAKDREMASVADFGLMIWDGKSPGTILNVLRLVRLGKKAVLVNAATHGTVNFKTTADWVEFLSECSPAQRHEFEKRALPEEWLDTPGDHATFRLSMPDGERTEATTFEAGDPKSFVEFLGRLARERGMSQVAADTGLAREALYRALGAGGNPEFATVVKVATALGLTLSARKNSAA